MDEPKVKENAKKRVEYTEEERMAKKIFQNYFTKLLYEKPTSAISPNGEIKKYEVYTTINEILKESALRIWLKIIDFFYTEFEGDEPSIIELVKKGWDEYCRFYLKGGKSTLEFINGIINRYKEGYEESTEDFYPSQNHKSNIAKAFYQELKYNTDDSDFDFCFVVKPELLSNSNFIRINRKISKLIKKEANDIEAHKIFPDFLERINNTYNQKNILKKLIEESITNFTPEEQVIFNDFLNVCDTIQEPYFKFMKEDKYIKAIEKKVTIPTDTFYLHRIVIPFKFEDEKMKFPTVEDKLFAECIDISFSSNEKVNRKLWMQSGLDKILRPLLCLDEMKKSDQVFSYPVVGLHYQLNDIVIILSENSPNKPQKRCKRLIEQLYFSCMEEKLPELPSIIHIGKTVYELMQEENECKALNSIMKFKTSIKIKEEEVYVFEINESLRDIEKFELWCNKSFYKENINLKWESQCNIDFLSKEELRRRIINICKEDFNVTVKEEFKEFNKMYLCVLYKNLILISTILNIWEGHRDINLEDTLISNWKVKDNNIPEIEAITNYRDKIKKSLRSDITRLLQYYVDKQFDDLYYIGVNRPETFIGYVKRFFSYKDNGIEKASFIELVSKFTLK